MISERQLTKRKRLTQMEEFMRTMKRTRRFVLALAALLLWAMALPVLAASDDNSLSALNVHNGTVTPDFAYNIWEYEVTVEPGTTELLLEPTTSDANASITSITGTVLQDGKATVFINTMSESGSPMTYTLYVSEGGDAATETEAVQTEPQTEKATEAMTEAVAQPLAQTETQTEAAATNTLQDQITKLKSNSDLMMKIVYGLIALAVILLFLIINLILKNRDLKDDLKDAEDQLAYQTNEFARKEKSMVTDNYYAPTQQGRSGGEKNTQDMQQDAAAAPVTPVAPAVEETFGTRGTPGGYQGMQPEDVLPSKPITADIPAQQPVTQETHGSQPEQTPQEAAGNRESAPTADDEKKDVNVTMVEL